tara:strand:- start:1324 stop:1863 length:540 start_codon:yes stop_codon:yes gene_type:complete
MTSKTYTIRGTLTVADNAIMDYPLNILTYSSPDRTKAWKIRKWWMWPKNVRAEIGSQDGQFQLNAALTTDSWLINDAETITDVSENRNCGWLSAGYSIRHGAGASDFLADQSRGDIPEGIIDEDRLITDRLYIVAQTTSESGTSPSREWNYMVVVDAVKVTPLESVVQQLKGVGQDLEN